jgi:DNA-binding SARP family transcriptional activator
VSTLRIRLFGSMEIERDGKPLARFPSRKVRDLFAYLALNRQSTHSREHLAGLFWGESDDDRARHSLNTALWRLNGVLTESGGGRARAQLRVTPQEIGFNASGDFWLDVAEFESRCALGEKASNADEQAALYAQAVSFYRAELLTDCYEEWCVLERERLHCRFLRALEQLLSYHARGRHTDVAIDYAKRILACDSLREEVHRQLIELYLTDGQPAAALRQYRQCEELLQRELAVQPMAETRALLTRILSAEHIHVVPREAPPAPEPMTPSTLAEMARELAASFALVQQAAAACTQAQARLQQLYALHLPEARITPLPVGATALRRATPERLGRLG